MNSDKQDIRDATDIERFVDTFYDKVRQDEQLGFLFNEVANVDWAGHLPKMYAFWATLIFGDAGSYKGNPMQPHLDLGRQTALTPEHFKQWLYHFDTTIDQLFRGEVAQQTKIKARSIATVIESKLYQMGLLAGM